MNYYNENDKKAAAWLRELIKAKLIPDGEVDERSINDVAADDVRGFRQCHFFAGIGGWPYALSLAKWPEDQEVWTGSCPCQPFSCAGKQNGTSDERHLWPEFRRLIASCRPKLIFGEQVSGSLGREWLGGYEGVQRVSDQQAIKRVLQVLGISEQASPELQKMLSSHRERGQGEDSARGEEREISGMEEKEQSEGASPDCGISSEAKRNRILPVAPHFQNSRCDRCGRLRANWNSFQSGWGENVGQPLPGSDRFEPRLFPPECACGALLRERDGEHLGSKQDNQSRGRNHGYEEGRFAQLSIQAGSCTEEEIEFLQFSGVRLDLETLGYAFGGSDLPACSVGAPHIRQRLFWVAESQLRAAELQRCRPDEGRPTGVVDDSDHQGPQGRRLRPGRDARQRTPWETGFEVVQCTDGKARRFESGSFPLADGFPGRVGLLRGYGNAIVPQVAAEFIGAYIDTLTDQR